MFVWYLFVFVLFLLITAISSFNQLFQFGTRKLLWFYFAIFMSAVAGIVIEVVYAATNTSVFLGLLVGSFSGWLAVTLYGRATDEFGIWVFSGADKFAGALAGGLAVMFAEKFLGKMNPWMLLYYCGLLFAVETISLGIAKLVARMHERVLKKVGS